MSFPNLHVVRSFNIEVAFTPEQWGLYHEDFDCAFAAKQMNKALENSVAAHSNRTDVYREVSSICDIFKDKGGSDPYVKEFLSFVLDILYGRDLPLK